MRSDAVGLLWQDETRPRQDDIMPMGAMPPIPDTGWRTPREFPNLREAPIIGLDVETYDPLLLTHGPGWARRRHSGHKRGPGVPTYLHPVGCLVGVSVAAYGRAWYFPMRHTVQHETNIDPEHVLAWLRHTLSGTQPKLGTNLIYDVGWLREEGVEVNGPLLDISYAEALLTEAGSLSLDKLSHKYLGLGKESSLLFQWCRDYYGGTEYDQRKNIWRSPPCLVGPYAEADAMLPLRVFEQQKKLLGEQGLLQLFDMECRLTRLLLDMRFRGVAVDLERAEQVDQILTEKAEAAQHKLNKLAGAEVDVNKPATIAPAFDRARLKYQLTEKTEQPSFTREFLKTVDHPLAHTIMDLRRYLKLRDTFVRSYVMKAHVNGRLHGQFHALRGESKGTRSGRFSSSDPNLQNIPSRDPELAPLVRSIFVPELGALWRRYDYSQIEYRFLLHFATGEGAEEARKLYWEDPKTDYHAVVQRMLKERMGLHLDRKPTKNINFGLAYGMGEPKLARVLQLSATQAKQFFQDYHAAVPYVHTTMEQVAANVSTDGYVATILGRRSRFDLYVPKGTRQGSKPLPFDQAVDTYGSNVERVGLHKALNRLLQGSAADLIKRAMLQCYESGLFNDDRLPLLTVHDELDFSASEPRDPVWNAIKHVMETAIPLRVPVLADSDIGPNWGNLKEEENEAR